MTLKFTKNRQLEMERAALRAHDEYMRNVDPRTLMRYPTRTEKARRVCSCGIRLNSGNRSGLCARCSYVMQRDERKRDRQQRALDKATAAQMAVGIIQTPKVTKKKPEPPLAPTITVAGQLTYEDALKARQERKERLLQETRQRQIAMYLQWRDELKQNHEALAKVYGITLNQAIYATQNGARWARVLAERENGKS